VRGRSAIRTFAAALAIAAAEGVQAATFAWLGRAAGIAAAMACALGWGLALALALPVGTLCLVASLGLGVLAAVAGAPAGLAAAGAGAAVAAWDLTLLATEEPRAVDGAGERRVLASRIGALGAGILPGVALAALLGAVRLELPFVAVVAAALLLLGALDRVARRRR